MNEQRRQELRQRYLRLTNEAAALLTAINPRLGEIDRELEVIEIEVLAAMAANGNHP